jgi:hypothetical protein
MNLNEDWFLWSIPFQTDWTAVNNVQQSEQPILSQNNCTINNAPIQDRNPIIQVYQHEGVHSQQIFAQPYHSIATIHDHRNNTTAIVVYDDETMTMINP